MGGRRQRGPGLNVAGARETRLLSALDLTVAPDYGQIYIWSAAMDRDDYPDEDNPPEIVALADATDSGRFVGVIPGLIDLMTPGQWNAETPMRVEVWSAEPPDDRDGWDHEVDVDFDVPDGEITFQGSGGGPWVDAEIPAGSYRARVSGRGFTELGHAGAEGDDSYRLRLWPRDQAAPPELRKRWPGWDGYA